MNKRNAVAVILMCMIGVACVARSPERPRHSPVSLGIIQSERVDYPGEAGLWGYAYVFTPVAMYDSGHWIGADDGGESSSLTSKAYFETLAGQTFHAPECPGTRFVPNGVVDWGVTGNFEPKPKIVEEAERERDLPPAYYLLWAVSRRVDHPREPRLARDDEAVLTHAQRCLDEARASMLGKHQMATLQLAVKEPFELKEWRPFRVSKHESAVWVEVRGVYQGKPEDADENDVRRGPWEASYFGILRRTAQREYTPMWEYACLLNYEVSLEENSYSFQGCCDVTGDGTSEVLLCEWGYECRALQVHELHEPRNVLVAARKESAF